MPWKAAIGTKKYRPVLLQGFEPGRLDSAFGHPAAREIRPVEKMRATSALYLLCLFSRLGFSFGFSFDLFLGRDRFDFGFGFCFYCFRFYFEIFLNEGFYC